MLKESYDRWATRHPLKEKPFPLRVPFEKLSYPLRLRLFDDSVFKREGVSLLLDREVGAVFKSFDEGFPGLQLHFSHIFPESSILSRWPNRVEEEARTTEEKLKEVETTNKELQRKLSEAEKRVASLELAASASESRPPQRRAAARAMKASASTGKFRYSRNIEQNLG